MISYIIDKQNHAEIAGLSTDTKPTDAPNGSTFIEMDTGDVYMYNADDSEWVELFSFGD